jgi:hypothetical protein
VAPVFLLGEAVKCELDFGFAEVGRGGGLGEVGEEHQAKDAEGDTHCSVCVVLVWECEGEGDVTDDEDPLPALEGSSAVQA